MAKDSTAVFSFKISESAVSGDYTLRIYSSSVPLTTKTIRVYDYSQKLLIKASTESNTYVGGETIKGRIEVANPDGSPFTEIPTFDLSAYFKTSTVTQRNQKLDL